MKKYETISKILMLQVLLLLSGMLVAQDHPALLPEPQQIKYGKGSIQLSGLTIFLSPQSSTEDKFNAKQLSEALKKRTGISVPVVNEKNGKQIIVEHGDKQ